ncbi:uncharacterized protein HMPREF1541_04466 [Cyphellophora europaea CBS 101466]|uniref:Uncharacterized protein n=1 Tax=Cyphellophora europaea (strain CBS 101466) TaxID=1220924 RepID=W2RV57_CYPE1|nr:uncharacterized protein HMPREF1541_04466 [Cyphellophora europaea CBS 101466]ETN40190.1 hypothetical protein HMPREF1541_04466 [Cyphellophora europaea CBS 101466]
MAGHSPAPSVNSAASESDNDSQHTRETKGAALKDKECQYCHQKFTSSSLGRHLDQFINKKKPDGIHNVDEIRRLRGGITRRTARSSKKQQQQQEFGHNVDRSDTPGRPSPVPQSINTEAPVDRLNNYIPGSIHSTLNRLTWHSTGVITDPTSINPSPSSTNTPANTTAVPAAGASPTKKRDFSAYSSDLPTAAATTSAISNSGTTPTALADTARALELSLREVLDSLRAASKHINTPPTPFDFEIQSQTYPSLVLRLLPTPPTLMQTSPFSTLQSVPISAPGPDQLTPLRNRLTLTIDRWKWNALRLAQRTTSNIADEASFLSSQADTYTSAALNHLNTSFENWMVHPAETRDALWHVELLRAMQGARDRAAETEERMEELCQERNQLRQQVEYLSRCQWPREMALWPPERLTYGKKMQEEIRLINLQRPPYATLKGQPDAGAVGRGVAPMVNRARSEGAPAEDGGVSLGGNGGGAVAGEMTDEEEENPNMVTENVNTRGDKWDFDKLVGKWRAHVKEDRLRRAPWLHYNSGGANGLGGQLSASPVADASGRAPPGSAGPQQQHNGNGARAAEGSPNTGGEGEGQGQGPGQDQGQTGLGIRKDGTGRRPFGRANNVRIVSDW